MYNIIKIENELERLSSDMGGVFSRNDLVTLLNIPETSVGKLDRIISLLVKNRLLYRFCRGYYVRKKFDIGILSQKIDPNSYISFTNVLGRCCVVGVTAGNSIIAVSSRPRPRIFSSALGTIKYVTMYKSFMNFGIEREDNLWIANPERALIDVLYFYKRGMQFNFNVYSDINVNLLDIEKVLIYLKNYKNPNFTGFVRSVINENRKI